MISQQVPRVMTHNDELELDLSKYRWQNSFIRVGTLARLFVSLQSSAIAPPSLTTSYIVVIHKLRLGLSKYWQWNSSPIVGTN